VALLIGIVSAPVSAQSDESESVYTACGRQAKDAGVTGSGAVSVYVAKCVAEKQAARELTPKDKDKAKDKDKTKDKDKDKSKDKGDKKSKSKDKKKEKDKKSKKKS
jgi:hypothetical protein